MSTVVDVHAPDSTRPANVPITTHSQRRRTSRGRPIVATITTPSSTTENTSVCPMAGRPHGRSTSSGASAPNATSR